MARAFGMPLDFVGVAMGARMASTVFIAPGIGMSLLAAGAVVGAVYGLVLVRLPSSDQGTEVGPD